MQKGNQLRLPFLGDYFDIDLRVVATSSFREYPCILNLP